LEAMSMGKAVIASNVDGTCEIIKDEYNGCLIALNNLQNELAEKIILLANDSELRQQYGSNAMNTVKNRFNAATMTKKIEDIYTSLLK
jgi:glycosyltransferase involved in cell wall biosynthesis